MSSAIADQTSIQPYTHYNVLGLARNDLDDLSKDNIKAAYRRALLIHHPDKSASLDSTSTLRIRSNDAPIPQYSVDEIVTAYEILSDPTKRASYDHTLEQHDKHGWKRANGPKDIHIGVETYDLEDLLYDEAKNIWSKACRCGDEKGYTLTELDLERESRHGEIYAGCHGCSLFIKVQFAVEEI
jgi:diphthamide biosynthesis protein 4